MNKIEIEFRAIITKEKYDWLHEFLQKNGEDLGEDNKETMFFKLTGKLLKVVNEESRGKAKIVLKNNNLGNGSNFEEYEVEIDPEQYEEAIRLFECLNIAEIQMRSFQKRRNYL